MMPMPMRRPSRWPTFATLLVSLVALGFAVAAWLRPLPEPSPPAAAAPTFTDQQVADAKAKVCDAYGKVRRAVDMNASRSGGDDPNSQLLIAVNARQIYISGSEYLMTILAQQPAIPSDLAAKIQKLANLLQVITLDGLASDPSDQKHEEASEMGRTIEGQCG